MFVRTLLVVIVAWGGSDSTLPFPHPGALFRRRPPVAGCETETETGIPRRAARSCDWTHVSDRQELVHPSRPAGSEPRKAPRSAEICPAVTLLAIRHTRASASYAYLPCAEDPGSCDLSFRTLPARSSPVLAVVFVDHPTAILLSPSAHASLNHLQLRPVPNIFIPAFHSALDRRIQPKSCPVKCVAVNRSHARSKNLGLPAPPAVAPSSAFSSPSSIPSSARTAVLFNVAFNYVSRLNGKRTPYLRVSFI